ncbi:MAG: undecaprenyl-diphosphate phosphatase [Cyclobacteriaceae bacterium]|nr:undecaprenyl-diphosphate phosphatase [Cyclobacteriaceae bacterium]MCH8516699.1 undecaprenyl-diphosphate phosphatase [Cyclobacteriaceae bacterium]
MGIIEALILGLLQGFTEFLPISSSGHIEIGAHLLGVEAQDHLLFQLVVHLATVISTLIVFWKDIINIIQDLLRFELNDNTKFVGNIILSAIPLMIAGLFFEKEIEALFSGEVLFIGMMLLLTALLLGMTYFNRKIKGTEVTTMKALVIGFAQMVALIPGVSRSGSTIATALLIGVDKEKATRFSFLMILGPIIGASLLKLKSIIGQPMSSSTEGEITAIALLVGFIASLVAGWISCKWMIDIVKKGKLIYFAIYCLIVGFIVIFHSLYF